MPRPLHDKSVEALNVDQQHVDQGDLLAVGRGGGRRWGGGIVEEMRGGLSQMGVLVPVLEN